MAKQYKSGQLITINHNVYRVHKTYTISACRTCAFRFVSSHEEPCTDLCMDTMPGKSKLPLGHYLKLIKSCTNQDS